MGAIFKPVSDEAENLIKEGKKRGISKMDEILEPELEKIENSDYKNLKAKLRQRIETARNEGYLGDVKGDEVTLPAF